MPTPDTFDYAAAVANLKRRFEKRRNERLALHEKASRDCAAIVKMIIADYKPTRIYQWGSLLRPEQFDENSDIDIAVEGVSEPGAWFAMLGKAMDMTSFPLDIVDIDKIEPAHVDSIRNRGAIVYEK